MASRPRILHLAPLTPALSPSDGARVPAGQVRGSCRSVTATSDELRTPRRSCPFSRQIPALAWALVLAVSALSLARAQDPGAPRNPLDSISESYVKLVLNVGLYDPDLVDAYFGPTEWKPAPLSDDQRKSFPKERFQHEAAGLLRQLDAVDGARFSPLERQRHSFLRSQLEAIKARIYLLSGVRMTFDEESRALYGVVAPPCSQESLDAVLKDLGRLLPGEGDLTQRFNEYNKQFIVPPERVAPVFQAAITEARRRTLLRIALPADERFVSENVTGRSWSAYNWYQGNHFSVIQVNTDLPVYLGDLIVLAAHEGYPGHHVQNVLMESRLRHGQNWIEFCISPLFSPINLLAEGAADHGVEVAFPDRERLAFERQVLFPLAGLDPAKAKQYFRVRQLTKRLRYAGIEMARRYLDGTMSKADALAWSMKYELKTPEKATRSVRFVEQYRSYIVNYAVGEDLVKQYVEKRAGRSRKAEARWRLLQELFANPHTPADIQ